MNNQEIKQKLESIIFNATFSSQFDYEVKEKIAIEAFNLGVILSAENDEADTFCGAGAVIQDSILKLSIK